MKGVFFKCGKKDFAEEEKKLEEVLVLAKEELETTEAVYARLEQNTYDEETVFNLSKTYATKIRNLEKSLKRPYFARIDFAEKNKSKQKIYIGKANIFDEDLNVVVADWRAPISSIYYDGQIGEVEYKCLDGLIRGDLSLKRQYTIDEGKLIDYNDIEITTSDEMLQNALNENSDARLKNIVATIQKEQNEIIRANMFKPLIIQGVAGSGKTTVALHRIAYLVYTYEKCFKPEDFLIIGPNKFFLSYISDVLPDLGVDYVMQQTFEEFAKCYIKEKIVFEGGNEKLKQIVESENSDEEINSLICASKFKSSMEFKNYIDKCMQTINEQYLPKEDFKVKDIVVIKYDELLNMFLNGFEEISIEDRIERLEKFMINKTSNVADSILDKIKEERAKELNDIPKQLSEKEQKKYRDTIFAKMEYEIDSLLKDKGKKLVKDYIKKLNKLSSVQIYKKIINGTELEEITNYSEYMRNSFNKKITKKIIEYEDIAPIMYISFKLFKQNEKLNLKHIIIDEAQDFSEFQFIVLYEILNKNKSITVLGDLAQGIYSYRGTENWQRINELVFNGEAKIQNLEKSYRTTIDIMNEANKVLSKINEKIGVNLGESISQNGIKPIYFYLNSFEEKIEKTINLIDNSKTNRRNNIGIIAKDSKQCEKIYKVIKNKYDKVQLISDQIEVFDGGITIVPSYYSKGLEFDSVIIWDYNNYKDTTLDIKLLYIAMTRAMHELNVLKNY